MHGYIKMIIDYFDVRCPVCLTVFDNPLLVCENGHNLCRTCFLACDNTNRCPTCKADMFDEPVPNRSTMALVSAFFREMSESGMVYRRGDQIDVDTGFRWVLCMITDIDYDPTDIKIHAAPVLPAPYKEMNSPVIISWNNHRRRIAPARTHTPNWRNIPGLVRSLMSTRLWFLDSQGTWRIALMLWTRDPNDVLIGYEDDERRKLVEWVGLDDENLFLGENPITDYMICSEPVFSALNDF